VSVRKAGTESSVSVPGDRRRLERVDDRHKLNKLILFKAYIRKEPPSLPHTYK